MRRRNSLARLSPRSRRQAKRSAQYTLTSGYHKIADLKRNVIPGVLLAAATVALYARAIGNPFVVLDDSDYVTSNLHVQRGLSWSTVKWAFTTFAAANWHPVTWLSHAMDFQLFALNPVGHHAHSILIHALNAVLLFLLLQWLTGQVRPSLLVAALFAVHPLNVESVAWVAERKNVLSTLFFFLALAAYGWYAQKPQWKRYLSVAGLFALGLMAKPMLVTLPFVLLLLDYWPLGRFAGSAPSPIGAQQSPAWQLLLEKVPLLLFSAASSIITLKTQHSGYAVRTLSQFAFGERIKNALLAYGLYLWKMIWPTRLAPLYPHPGSGLPPWRWIFSTLILVSITALTIILRRHRYLLVGWLWFLGTMVPVIGLVQVGDASMADRYAYLPLIGVFVMIAWSLGDLLSHKAIPPARAVIAALCALIGLSCVTYRQIGYWDSEYDLQAHTLAVTDLNPFAYDALGAALMEPAIAMSPKNLAEFDSDQKRMKEAQGLWEQSLSLRRQLARQDPSTYLPDMTVTLNNLGNLARSEGHTAAARQYYEEGLEIHSELMRRGLDPYPADRATALLNLGYLERSEQQNDQALRYFDGSLNIYRQLAQKDPDTYLTKVAEALNSAAVTERDEKKTQDAIRDYNEALSIRRQLVEQYGTEYVPYLAITLNDLGIVDAADNRASDAERHYKEALKLYRDLAEQDPNAYLRYLAGTLNNLAFLYQNENRTEESGKDYAEALTIYSKLYREEPSQYRDDVARVEISLEQLQRKPANK